MVEALGAKSHVKFQHNAGNSYTTTIGSKTLGAGNVGLTFDTGTSGGGTKMTIDVNGRIGIGTELPQTMHHLFGSSGLYTRFESAQGQVNFGNSNGAGIIHVTSTSQPLRILVNGNNERLRIKSDGIIGVNNTEPEGKGIDVAHSRTNGYSTTSDTRNLAHIIARNSSDGAGRFAALSFINGGGTQAEGSINLVQTGNYTGDLTFKIRTAVSTWAERLRIASTGAIQFNGTNSADNTNKLVYLTTPSYDIDEEPFGFIHSGTYNNQNLLYLGGGMTSSYNACTLMKFYTTNSINTIVGTERLCIESWGGIQNNQGAIYGGGEANEPKVHFNGAAPSNDPARGQLAVSDSAAYNASPIARISLVTRYNSAGGYTFMGGIEGGKENSTDGQYGGFVRIMTRPHGNTIQERLRISSTGQVTKPASCAFNVTHNGNQNYSSAGTHTVTSWKTTQANKGFENTTTGGYFSGGIFTAPVTGAYFFTSTILLKDMNGTNDVHLIWSKNDAYYSYWETRFHQNSTGYGNYEAVSGQCTMYMTAGDTCRIKITFTGSGCGIYGADSNWGNWGGFLIG